MDRTVFPSSAVDSRAALTTRICPSSTLQVVLEMASDAVFFVAPESLALLDANRVACASVGYTRDELLRTRLDALVPTLEGSGHRVLLERLRRAGAEHVALRGTWRGRDGAERPVELLIRQVEAASGPVLVVVANQACAGPSPPKKRDAFPRDELTGLHGRSMLEARLPRELEPPSAGYVGVLFLDVDRFKQINDLWGHLAGDRVLKAVAQRLVGCLRPDDIAIRYGGDEFVVLVTRLKKRRNAVRVAQRVCQVMRATFDVGGQQLRVSASVGVAISADGLSAEQLVHRADQAMYRAKAQGREGHYWVYGAARGISPTGPSAGHGALRGCAAHLPR